MTVSRRDFLKGVSIGALGVAAGARLAMNAEPAQAQTIPTSAAFYRTTLGDFEVTVIRDAVSTLGLSTLVANADADDVNELLASVNAPTGEQPNNFKQLLINTGNELVLFDTGLGSENSQLIPTLELLGVAPADITHVILSHWHPDHIGGVAPDGEIAFPEATYLMPQAEWDNLNSDPESGGFQGALSTLQPLVDAGVLDYFGEDAEIVSGIQAVPAYGHTAGHTAFLITSGDMQMLNVVDAIVHPIVSTRRTDWYFGFDSNPDNAVETRRALLSRVAENDLMMFGYHFPFPGIGYVTATDEENSYIFTPFAY